MEEVLQFLEAVHPLSEELAGHLTDILRAKQVQKKQFILKAGHICRHIWFIRKGIVRCYYLKNDTEVCSWFMKEGDVVISIESFYQQTPGNEFIQALEDTECWGISYAQLQEIYRIHPEFNLHGRVITERYHQHWARQLFSIRMQTAMERYQWLMNNHPELVLRVPAKYLATYLDISEITLSIIKGKMF